MSPFANLIYRVVGWPFKILGAVISVVFLPLGFILLTIGIQCAPKRLSMIADSLIERWRLWE